jgi:hypothetical protein
MKTIKPANRRNFLLAAGLGSAGVAAAVVTAATRAKDAAPELPEVDKATGYRASAHVLKYYQTTKV